MSGRLPEVWTADRTSIFEFLSSRSPEEDFRYLDLPDEPERGQTGDMRWAPGALDGVSEHHGVSAGDDGHSVFSALQRACETPSAPPELRSLYAILKHDAAAVDAAETLASLIAASPSTDAERLFRIAMWLATQSPDREPVKFGIALLGAVGMSRPSVDILMTLGRHEEFTLYVAEALAKLLPEDKRDRTLWQLACKVSGWGRIHLVEKLAGTPDARIKAWLLREGYRNSIMYEYLAHTCAAGGDLVTALRDGSPDDALLTGAREILLALIAVGPARDMSHYADGAEAVRLFVGHMERAAPSDLEDLVSLNRIKSFVDDDNRNWKEMRHAGWSPALRQEISSATARMRARPEWKSLVSDGLHAADNSVFRIAAEAAPSVGIDPWETVFDRQEADEAANEWFFLMQTEERDRAMRVAELAMRQLDLQEIATGPGLELGIGGGFEAHEALDCILQELVRFPAIGWPLVHAGLQSPAVRNRYGALRVLSVLGSANWSGEMVDALETALSREPDPEMRKDIRKVLSGKRLR